MFTLCGIPYGVSVLAFFYVYMDNGFGKYVSCNTKYELNCHKLGVIFGEINVLYVAVVQKKSERFEKLQVVLACILQQGDTEMQLLGRYYHQQMSQEKNNLIFLLKQSSEEE